MPFLASIAVAALSVHSAMAASSVYSDAGTTSKAIYAATADVEMKGDYYMQNVKSGQYLSFSRPDGADHTMITMSDEQATVTLTTVSADGLKGVVVSGQNDCASAQWAYGDDHDGQDTFFAPYACRLGPDAVTDDEIVLAKQIWQFIPIGSASDDSSDSTPAVADAKFAKVDAETSSASASSDSSAPCQHPGKWLSEHREYMSTGGHTECIPRFKAYMASQRKRHFVKRAKGAMHGSTIAKRASSQKYCIAASDHLEDMTPRTVTGQNVAAAAGWLSQALAEKNCDDEDQQWLITPA